MKVELLDVCDQILSANDTYYYENLSCQSHRMQVKLTLMSVTRGNAADFLMMSQAENVALGKLVLELVLCFETKLVVKYSH